MGEWMSPRTSNARRTYLRACMPRGSTLFGSHYFGSSSVVTLAFFVLAELSHAESSLALATNVQYAGRTACNLTLSRQISHHRCIKGINFGCLDDVTFAVSEGCNGAFKCGPGQQTVFCKSVTHQPNITKCDCTRWSLEKLERAYALGQLRPPLRLRNEPGIRLTVAAAMRQYPAMTSVSDDALEAE